MAVIEITVVPSSVQLISGIPKSVTIEVTIPSMIFYTFDGSDPTTESLVYTDELELPLNQSSVNLKIFATNGLDSSEILSFMYSPNISNARLPHSKVTFASNPPTACGSDGGTVKVNYSQPAGETLNAANVYNVYGDGYGFEPSIYPVREYDYNVPIFDYLYSTTDSKGNSGKNIGTLPAQSQILYVPPPPESSEVNKETYNAKAMVIFHDGTKPNSNEREIFRPYYSGEDLEISYGSRLNTTNETEGNTAFNGALVNYYYNSKDNTYNFYYWDNICCRWIISKEPAREAISPVRDQKPYAELLGMSTQDRYVYKWMPYKRSGLI